MPVPAEIMQAVKNMRPLSRNATRLLEIVGKPNHHAQEIVQIVKSDSLLTANVLRVVNSVAYYSGRDIESVEQALPRMGEQTVIGIALGLCAAGIFFNRLEGYESEQGELWKHSLRCGIAARGIAEHALKHVEPEVAFTAGIVHDIGKAIISTYLVSHTSEMIAGTTSGVFSDFIEAEQETLGTNHCEIGGLLAEQWKFPATLRQVIEHHHEPLLAGDDFKHLVFTVHLGDFIAMMSGGGTGADTMAYKLCSNYREFIRISIRELEGLIIKVNDEYEKSVAVMFPEGRV